MTLYNRDLEEKEKKLSQYQQIRQRIGGDSNNQLFNKKLVIQKGALNSSTLDVE